MIVFVDIIQILMFYNDISFSHQFPDGPDTLHYISAHYFIQTTNKLFLHFLIQMSSGLLARTL